MHLIRRYDASTSEGDLETRRYYAPDRDPLEVIETIMSPNASQTAHLHETVREAMLVLEGSVRAEEIISGKSFGRNIAEGDFVVFDRGILHRMENRSNRPARTLHFKFLGENKDRALFLKDKSDLEATLSPNTDIPNLETRYAAYVETHNNLDKLVWQVPMFLVAVSALGFGLMGTSFPDNNASVPPFSHIQTFGLLFTFWGVLYLLGCYAMERLQYHHSLAAKIIAPLDPGGYFESRVKSINGKWPSASGSIKAVFGGIGISLVSFGILIFFLL